MSSTAAIAQKWLDAFNAHHIARLLELYDDNAVHFSPKLKIHQPETGGIIRGKDALRAWWQDAIDRLPSLHYQLNSLTADSHQVFMEYTRQVSGEEDIDVAEVLRIRDGLIIASRVYHG
jgi:ketosteroid isomerase-like protein